MQKIHLVIRVWPYEGIDVETAFLDREKGVEYVERLNRENKQPLSYTFELLSTTIEDAE